MNHTASTICLGLPSNRSIFFGGLQLMALMAIVLLSHSNSLFGQTTGPEKGVFFIHGGGRLNFGEFVNLAKQASGKPQPAIVIISTPQGKKRQDQIQNNVPLSLITRLKKRFKMEHVSELFTLSKAEADSDAFVKQIDDADAVFLTGGNQSYLIDAFSGTKSLAALERLLDRGGLIGGASAGAQVQSSFMTRGGYKKRRVILGDKEHQAGFSFVKNSAFDVHVEERNREQHLLQLFRANEKQLQDPQLNPLDLLGIGIDQSTAIVVKENQFQVTGKGQVYIFDPEKWDKDDPDSWSYQILKSGTFFDMKYRKVIEKPEPEKVELKKTPTSPKPKTAEPMKLGS